MLDGATKDQDLAGNYGCLQPTLDLQNKHLPHIIK